ncbi:MAG: DUF4388 domain-containing protein [Chloroflexia bacterium]|nr:DUF4388 domain-containing protein [Chloroflexia bacterium]
MAVSGNLRDMTLTTLISVNCNEGNQALLRLRRGEEEAQIYFDEGNIVHMVLDDREGEEVIHELLAWEDAQFELEMGVAAPARTVQTLWSNLVLGGMQMIDEAELTEEMLAEIEMEEDLMANLQEVLREMGSLIPGFIATDVVGMDGLSIGGYAADPHFDGEAASAQFALVMKLVQRTVGELAGGEVEDNLVTTDRIYILTRFLGDGSYYLGMAIDKEQATLGNVRLVSRRFADRIWAAIPKF